MNELIQYTDLNGTTARRRLFWAAGFLGVVATIALAVGIVFAFDAIDGLSAPVVQAPTTTSIQPGSRADDYGLRHDAVTVPQAPAASRLDDFGLRHPQSVTVGAGSRSDDYGLRHPQSTTVAAGSRSDDYGLRHPAP
jgi:hypothetical protein